MNVIKKIAIFSMICLTTPLFAQGNQPIEPSYMICDVDSSLHPRRPVTHAILAKNTDGEYGLSVYRGSSLITTMGNIEPELGSLTGFNTENNSYFTVSPSQKFSVLKRARITALEGNLVLFAKAKYPIFCFKFF
jgi:hypothetical protein